MSVICVTAAYQLWAARPVASDRTLRSQLPALGQSSVGNTLRLGISGAILIWIMERWVRQSIAGEFKKFAVWADEVSSRKSNDPIPKLVESNSNPKVKTVKLEAIHERLAKAIGQLEFRYQQLLDERLRTADALQSTREGIIALDADLELLLINEAARELLDVNAPVRIGKPLIEIIRQPQVIDLVRNVHRSKKAAESVLATGASQGRLLRLRVSPLHDPKLTDEADSASGVMVLVSDVTRLTKLESMRRDFTANVSHELKTPLAAIQAYAETLLDGDAINDPDANRRFVEGIAKQADRLSALIHDLLQLAKLDAEPERVVLTEVDLLPIIEDVIHQHAPLAAARQVELKLDCSVPVTSVFATTEGVRAIVSNLVSNAIRYNKIGGYVIVRVETQATKTLLSVIDNGVGIPADQHDRIFERFYRVDKARSIDAGGTGLGLAIVKHLVQQMGGTISLQSKPGEGANFHVCFKNYSKSQLASISAESADPWFS